MKKRRSFRQRPIHIVVADDHPVVREGLVALIKSQSDMELVGEAASGPEAIREYFQHRPEVLLMDLSMPGMNGIEAARSILGRAPDANILMLSAYRTAEDIYQVLKVGVKAYLMKECPRTELLTSIRSVCDGQMSVSTPLVKDMMIGIAQERLTEREVEVIRLAAEGSSNKEIGSSLGITEGTVKIHLTHIFRKFRAKGRTEAIRLALERGVVQLSHW